MSNKVRFRITYNLLAGETMTDTHTMWTHAISPAQAVTFMRARLKRDFKRARYICVQEM